MVFPRLSGLDHTYLRTDAGRVSTLVRYLSESATTKKKYYRVWFDLEKGVLKVEDSRDGAEFTEEKEPGLRRIKLKDGVSFEDIVVPGLGKVNAGEVAINMTPAGSAEPFTLHMKAGGDTVTLFFNPLSGAVKTSEGYL